MAKIFHTGDIHLGIKLSGLGKSGDKVRASLKDAFARMINICLESDVDAFIIVGDLFDSNHVSKPLLDFALREIARLEKIPAIVIPGTHDCLEENSVWATIDKSECPDNLYVFNDPAKTRIAFPDLGLSFYARPNQTRKSTESPLAGLNPGSSPGYHIALAHGSLQIPGKSAPDDWPIGLEELESSGFDYIALGHWHSYLRAPTVNVPVAYSGSPEALSFKQMDAGWAALVELGDGKVEVEKFQIGKLEWSTVELPCQSYKYTLELEREITKHVGENHLLKILLTGIFPSDGYIDFERLHENMADQFLYLNVVNRSESIPEDLVNLSFPATTILGQYINLLAEETAKEQNPERAAILRESLTLGYALLSGKDAI